MIHRDRFLFSVVLVTGLIIANGVDAQVNFETAYGNGVHHYFSGNYQKAVDSLSLAIAEDARDPRAYYYRGLANERLGQPTEKDFQMGARMEVVKGGRLSIVNDALERVQGHTRISIEDFRRNALLTASNSNFTEPSVARPFPVANDKVMTVAKPAVTTEPSPELPTAPGQDVLPAAKIIPRPIKVTGTEEEMVEGPKPDEDAPLKEVGFDEIVPADDKAETVEDSVFGGDNDEPMQKEDAPEADGSSPFDEIDKAEDSPFEQAGGEVTEEPKKEDSSTESAGSPFDTVEDDEKDAVGEPVPSEDVDPEGAPDDPFDL